MKWYQWWVYGWIEATNGIITILTLGLYHPDWCYRYAIWLVERKFERRLK